MMLTRSAGNAVAYAGLPATEMIDLRLFFTRVHPAFGSNAAETAEQRRTGKTMVVIKTGPEAAAVSRGDGLAAWLGREGPRYRLPATMEALEADWHVWLEARFGKPGSAPDHKLAANGIRHHRPKKANDML